MTRSSRTVVLLLFIGAVPGFSCSSLHSRHSENTRRIVLTDSAYAAVDSVVRANLSGEEYSGYKAHISETESRGWFDLASFLLGIVGFFVAIGLIVGRV